MLTMALDRLKQLSAHEIGHTIGLAHNFAASSNNRASVMDYPHPYITMEDNQPNFKNAYDNKIGAWDKRAIIYGYGEPPIDQEEESFLGNLISENKENGQLFITDQDARPAGSLHPYAHLWDNGNDPIAELERMMILRKHVLDNLNEKALANDMPSSCLLYTSDAADE